MLNGSRVTTGARRRQSTKHLDETRKHTSNDRWVPLGFCGDAGAVTSLSLSPLTSPVVSQDCSCFGCFRNQVSLQCQCRMNHVASPDKKKKKKWKKNVSILCLTSCIPACTSQHSVTDGVCMCVEDGGRACEHACVCLWSCISPCTNQQCHIVGSEREKECVRACVYVCVCVRACVCVSVVVHFTMYQSTVPHGE